MEYKKLITETDLINNLFLKQENNLVKSIVRTRTGSSSVTGRINKISKLLTQATSLWDNLCQTI